jgi:urease accessory protein
VYLVNASAGPLGGDQLSLRITVRGGAFLRLRTVAASVALPGLDDGESLLAMTATVEEGGCLEYLPEPVVVADGARHATDIRVRLAAGARLVLREELILGRHAERGGSYRGSLRVDYAGRPLLRQCLDVSGTDAPSQGPAIMAGHRAAGTLLRVDEGRPAALAGPDFPASAASAASVHPTGTGSWVSAMPLATGPATLTTALARDALTLRALLPAGLPGALVRERGKRTASGAPTALRRSFMSKNRCMGSVGLNGRPPEFTHACRQRRLPQN